MIHSAGKMATFDSKQAYAPQEEVFFDDGREIELLHYVYGRPDINLLRGSPVNVLRAIDEFGRTRKYLMNVGEAKGAIVTELIAEVRPRTMVNEPFRSSLHNCHLSINSHHSID